jgi:hypothetical protein
VEELIAIAQSVEFKNAVKSKLRTGTFGLALLMDIDSPIDDALHHEDFYTHLSTETEYILNSPRLQRVLESPSLDTQTKLQKTESILKDILDSIMVRFRNGCFAEAYSNSPMCKRPQNIIKEMQGRQQLTKVADQKLQSLGQRAGLNLSGFSTLFTKELFKGFKGGKKTRKSKKSRRKQTRRRR